MTTILPTENQDWGFWGTMREHAADAWPIAFTAIHNATSTDPASVRAFLDSRYGRHFADGVNSQMHYGASLADAIAKTTAEWMGWRITQRTSRETGIPAGLPYLTGFVINEGIAAEAQDSLDVAAGEFVALVGPSGCGKSTLMRIVAGIETADAGSLSIGSRDVTALRAAERNVAMVFQNYALYPHLTVSENIAVPLAMRRLSAVERFPLFGRVMPGLAQKRAAIATDVLKAAQSLGLEALLDRKPGQLSGGQRQRVALARAIVRHPDAFLMDEPLSNLDAALRVQTRREIVEIHRRVGTATLYVTHDQSEALTMADRVAVMQAGQILQVSSPEAIYHDPQDIRVATFIGSPRINTISAQADATGHIHITGKPSGLHAAPGPVTIAIRPENLRLAAKGLSCVAEGFEFLGESLLLHALHVASNEALIVRLPPEVPRPHSGEAIQLTFEAKHALLFDQNGKRVALRDHPARSQELSLA